MSDFHDVIAKFEAAGVDVRKAYWGHPERPGECCNAIVGEHIATDGDLRFVVRMRGIPRDMSVVSVSKVDESIEVIVE